MPKNSELLKAYRSLIKAGRVEKSGRLENLLQIRGIRTLSGVTPMAVMTKPYVCPGQCVYCPLELGMPKSYLSDEPAAQRAKLLNFDPGKQIDSRLEQFRQTGHITEKIELIVIGGTFSNYPEDYKIDFFHQMFDAVNGVKTKSLEEAQAVNETAKQRIVGISIETRPDWITKSEVRLLRRLGVTKVQAGVQAFDEEILKKIKRGHSLDAVAEATRMLRDAGIKICYHFMPNLPGSNPKHDLEMARIMYEDDRFKPDFVKIYPCMVIPGTELFRMWERGEVASYEDDVLKELLKDIKKITPPWVRIDRLVRDISKKWVSSGTEKTNMRQVIHRELKQEGLTCRCIRCREIKGQWFDEKPELLVQNIPTYGGTEAFLTFEKNDHLYALLRLRLPDRSSKPLFVELQDAAIIREIHTFGTTVPISKVTSTGTQHHGLGKKLLLKAEAIARENHYSRMAVISSVGTREYYRKQGFNLKGLYMVKEL